MLKVDPGHIYAICSKYAGPGLYLGAAIPGDMFENFRKKVRLRSDDQVIAFILNKSIFKKGKYGLAIATSGVHWHNSWEKWTKKNFLNWDEFSNAEITKIWGRSVQLGRFNFFDMSLSDYDINLLVEMLFDIQNYLLQLRLGRNPASAPFTQPPFPFQTVGTQSFGTSFGTATVTARTIDPLGKETVTTQTFYTPPAPFNMQPAANPAPGPVGDGWMLAVAGQQYGPYDLKLLEMLVGSGKIAPENTYVWRPGMTDWEPFMNQPELAALVGKKGGPRMTPPPPPSSRGS